MEVWERSPKTWNCRLWREGEKNKEGFWFRKWMGQSGHTSICNSRALNWAMSQGFEVARGWAYCKQVTGQRDVLTFGAWEWCRDVCALFPISSEWRTSLNKAKRAVSRFWWRVITSQYRDHDKKLIFAVNDKICCTRNAYLADLLPNDDREANGKGFDIVSSDAAPSDFKIKPDFESSIRLCNGEIFFITGVSFIIGNNVCQLEIFFFKALDFITLEMIFLFSVSSLEIFIHPPLRWILVCRLLVFFFFSNVLSGLISECSGIIGNSWAGKHYFFFFMEDTERKLLGSKLEVWITKDKARHSHP